LKKDEGWDYAVCRKIREKGGKTQFEKKRNDGITQFEDQRLWKDAV
jgi:hypothetical protein